MAKNIATFLTCSVLCTLHLPLASTSKCPLPWNDPNRTGNIDYSIKCPYGRRLPGDVTLPNDASFIDYVSVVYGYLPFVVVGLGAIELLFSGPLKICRDRSDTGGRRIGTREASFVVFCLVIVILNELVLKSIVKDPRPDRSCNYSCGFPSGHSTMAVGFATLMFLDGSFRVFPKMPLSVVEAEIEADGVRHGRSFFPQARQSLIRLITIVPLSKGDVMSHFEFAVFASIWASLLLPVPISRLTLHDHTSLQIGIGSLIGIIEAGFWFYLTRLGQRHWNTHLNKSYGIFKHNYALPRFEVRSNCVRLLALCIDETASSQHQDKLNATLSELDWYVSLTKERLRHIHRARDDSGISFLGRDLEAEQNFLNLEVEELRQLQDMLRAKLRSTGQRGLTPVQSEQSFSENSAAISMQATSRENSSVAISMQADLSADVGNTTQGRTEGDRSQIFHSYT